MKENIRILVIEDDEDLLDTLGTHLRNAGMEVKCFNDPRQLGPQPPAADIVVCDINLPGESGFSLAARLRMASRLGIIMLTGRTQQEDRLLGLSLGADHYVVKPFNLNELELLIRNLYRRITEAAQAAPSNGDPVACWRFDTALWTLTAPNGKKVRLTLAEYHFMECLLSRAGEVASRDDLLDALGRPNIDGYNRNLDVTISRLRRKVEKACGEKLPILSARGSGYVFTGRSELCG